MRVIHLISSTDRRGAQVFASQLVNHLGGPPNHELLAIASGTASKTLDVDVLGTSRTSTSGLLKLVRMTRSADLLIAHGSDALLHAAISSPIHRRPFIYRNIGDPATWGAVKAANLRIGAPLRKAAAVSALFPKARDYLIDSYSLDPARVATIPNGVPLIAKPTPEDRAISRRDFGLSDGLTWVGFIGSLSPEKGVLNAIKAIASTDELSLVIAGSGPQDQEARSLANEIAPGRVTFVGTTDRPLDLIAGVDVVVIPSRTEGIPAAAIEAGLCGVPVVATNVGGVSEAVLNNMTGVLVESAEPATLADAIRQVAQRRAQLGAAARRHCVERFSMDRVADEWSDLINSTLR